MRGSAVIALLSLAVCGAISQDASINDSSSFRDVITEIACDPFRQPAIVNDTSVIISPPINENGTYELNMDCRWHVLAPQGYVIGLDFQYFDLDPIHPCADASVKLYDWNATIEKHLIETLCGYAVPSTIHTSYTDLFFVFESGGQGEGSGFAANFTFIYIQESCSTNLYNKQHQKAVGFEADGWVNGGIYSPNWYNPYPANSNCAWTINTKNQIRLEFQWFSIASCTDHSISVYHALENKTDLIGTFCGKYGSDDGNQYLPALPIGSKGGALEVKLSSFSSPEGSGFRAYFIAQNVTEIGCSPSKPLVIDWSPGIISSPSSNDSACSWRLASLETRLIKLTPTYFNLPICSSDLDDCACARLEIYDGETHNAPLIGKYCGRELENREVVFTSEYGFLQYYSMLTEWLPEHGFVLEHEFYDTALHACGENRPVIFTHEYGLVTSPNYDQGHYPSSSNCQWLVQTTFGSVIRMDFLDLDVENCYGECRCDYLSLYNGDHPLNDGALIGTFCGTQIPSYPIVSSLQSLYLTFVSDKQDNRDGFKIKFRSYYLPDEACDLTRPSSMTNEPGIIISQGYEKGINYLPNSFCSWRVTASLDHVVLLTLKEFSLEYYSDCSKDFLEVYDGMDINAKRLARLCGDVDSRVLESSGTYMYLEFHSNSEIESKGFHLEYSFKNPSAPNVTLGFLPVILILIIVFGIFIIIGAYCHISDSFKTFKNWMSRMFGRNRNQRHNSADTESTANENENQRSEEFQPVPLRSVTTPPSNVDDMHYYAIADYAPPTYEEATHQQHQQGAESSTRSASTSQNRLRRDESAENNTCERITSNSSDFASYPRVNQNAGSSTNVNSIQSNHYSVQGNPDMGMGILMRAGLYDTRNQRYISAPHNASPSRNSRTSRPSSHINSSSPNPQALERNSTNLNTSVGTNRSIDSELSTSLTNITHDLSFYNPVYTALRSSNRSRQQQLQRNNTNNVLHTGTADGQQANLHGDMSHDSDENIYDTPKDNVGSNPAALSLNNLQDCNKIDKTFQNRVKTKYNLKSAAVPKQHLNKAFVGDENIVNVSPAGKKAVNASNSSNDPNISFQSSGGENGNSASYDTVLFRRLNSTSYDTDI